MRFRRPERQRRGRHKLAGLLRILLLAVAAPISCASGPADPSPDVDWILQRAGVVPPSGGKQPIPGEIASDCSADVTAELNGWIKAAPNDSTLVLKRGGCYRVEGTVLITGKSRMVLDGAGATLRATTIGSGSQFDVRGRTHLAVTASDNIAVRRLVVRGAHPNAGASKQAYNRALEAQHGFTVLGSRQVLLEDVEAYDVYGDFVYIGDRSQGITVSHSRFARSGRQGVAVTDATDVAIVDNVIEDVARSMFDLETNFVRNSVRRIRVERNRTGAAVNFWIANKGAGNDIGDVVVADNTMSAPTGGLVFVWGWSGGARGPFVFRGNDLWITGAVTDEGAVGAFIFSRANDVTIENNRVRLPSGMPPVELRSCHDVRIENNRFPGAGEIIADPASTDVSVSRNSTSE